MGAVYEPDFARGKPCTCQCAAGGRLRGTHTELSCNGGGHAVPPAPVGDLARVGRILDAKRPASPGEPPFLPFFFWPLVLGFSVVGLGDSV